MAGRSQHHIPQCVLKGFARDPNENPQRVWEYRRGAPVAPRPTYEVAVQRDFYSKPSVDGAATLDDKITDHERDQLAPLLIRLRASTPGAPVTHDDAAQYLGHLISRGDYIRRMFADVMTRFLEDAKSLMSDADRMRAYLGMSDLEPGGMALDGVQKLMAENVAVGQALALLQIPQEPVERLGFALLREYGGQGLAQASAKAGRELEGLSIDVKGRVRQGHTEALERVGVAHRMKGLEGFFFSVEETQHEMVLPDCVAVAFDREGKASPFSFLKNGERWLILAPLAPHRALVGRLDQKTLVPDDAELAAKLASCAHMFFVAASDHFRALHASLGAVSDPEVSHIIEDVFARPGRRSPPEQECVRDTLKFQLRTPAGFSDAETAALGELISDVASDIDVELTLECLAGLIVTDGGALSDAGLYLVDQAAMDGEVNEGRLRLRTYLPRAVGEALVRDSDDDTYRQSICTLIAALARVGAASRLDALDASYLRDFGTESCPALLYRGVASALPAYRALATLRVLGERLGVDQLIEAAATNALSKADAKMAEAKAAFAADSNADAFALAASECVMMVTCASAAIAGRTEIPKKTFPVFYQALTDRGLGVWSEQFGQDLAAFWGDPGALENPRAWRIHSERLMARWGILMWGIENGQFMVRIFPEEVVEVVDKALKDLAARMDPSAA